MPRRTSPPSVFDLTPGGNVRANTRQRLEKIVRDIVDRVVYDPPDKYLVTKITEPNSSHDHHAIVDDRGEMLAAALRSAERLHEIEMNARRHVLASSIFLESHPDVDHLNPNLFISHRFTRRQVIHQRAVRFVDVWSAVLPQRIVDEELGDFMEDVSRRIAKGENKLVYFRMFTTLLWTAAHAIGYFLKAVGKHRAS